MDRSVCYKTLMTIFQMWVSVKLVDGAYHQFLKHRTSKEQAAAYLTKLNGGHIITIYLKQLKEWGLEEELCM